jgi:hypothetical protein
MDDSQFGGAVPAFTPLRVQSNSLGSFDFRNGKDGLYGLKGNAALAGTALDDAIFGTLLLPAPGSPRAVDLWPIFHTGVPNIIPYHLATGKAGNPLAAGKPFINNFLPNGGDMLRLNMAVPATPRDDANFSSLGLVYAAVLGLTDPAYNATSDLQFIPNMDGFPNGRRLEDDVTRIELQAVGGIVLAAIGLWYDDYDPLSSPSPVTPQLLNVIGYDTKVGENDIQFKSVFPYVQDPWSGTSYCSGEPRDYTQPEILPPTTTGITGLSSPNIFAINQPNPFSESTLIKYHLRSSGHVKLGIYDQRGRMLETLVNETQVEGDYEVNWNANKYPSGFYMAAITLGSAGTFTIKMNKTN